MSGICGSCEPGERVGNLSELFSTTRTFLLHHFSQFIGTADPSSSRGSSCPFPLRNTVSVLSHEEARRCTQVPRASCRVSCCCCACYSTGQRNITQRGHDSHHGTKGPVIMAHRIKALENTLCRRSCAMPRKPWRSCWLLWMQQGREGHWETGNYRHIVNSNEITVGMVKVQGPGDLCEEQYCAVQSRPHHGRCAVGH